MSKPTEKTIESIEQAFDGKGAEYTPEEPYCECRHYIRVFGMDYSAEICPYCGFWVRPEDRDSKPQNSGR